MVPIAAVTNSHKLGDLNNTIYSLTVAEARRLKSKYCQGHTSSGGSKEGVFQVLVATSIPGHITPLSASEIPLPPLSILASSASLL